MKFEHIKPFFTALGNETRFEIVQLVAERPRTVTDICKSLHCRQTKISNDLKCLRECGYVHVEKRGNERIYSVDRNILPILSSINKKLQKLTITCKGCKVCCRNNSTDKGRRK